jgi:hypothetical protein
VPLKLLEFPLEHADLSVPALDSIHAALRDVFLALSLDVLRGVMLLRALIEP